MLKFKISYGLQGNDNLMFQGGLYRNYYPYQDQYTLANSNGDFSTSLYYKGNKDITWETSHSFNTGFDFAFWGGKLGGSVEYFSRKTTDMLYFKPVAASMGYSRYPENVGSMVNRGVELDLYSNIIENKNFSWNINFNLTHFKNKVLELSPELNGQLIDGGRIYRVAGEMTSIGTLFAFTLVCAAVLIVRKSMPDVHRAFKTPFVPTVPILGILTCLCMMLFLPADTWIRLVLWMLIGLDVYACYGVKHSKLEHNVKRRKGLTILNMAGIALSVLSVITGLWHQQTVGWEEDKTLLAISFVFAFTHCAFYMVRIWKQTSEKKK